MIYIFGKYDRWNKNWNENKLECMSYLGSTFMSNLTFSLDIKKLEQQLKSNNKKKKGKKKNRQENKKDKLKS